MPSACRARAGFAPVQQAGASACSSTSAKDRCPATSLEQSGPPPSPSTLLTDLGDHIGARGLPLPPLAPANSPARPPPSRSQATRASRAHLPRQGNARPARQVPRPRRHRAALSPAVCGPLVNPDVRDVFVKRAAILRAMRKFSTRRLSRSRDAHDADHRRRRGGEALQDASQCARSRTCR